MQRGFGASARAAAVVASNSELVVAEARSAEWFRLVGHGLEQLDGISPTGDGLDGFLRSLPA